ncbi:MAG: VWA domain-containing protein [Xanthobacteraceae bacterium]
MARCSFVERLRTLMHAFRASQRGNVAMTFALATIPMIGFVGAAVDYSRGNLAKAAMQAAVDSTALMLSKDAQNLTTSQLNQKASDIFKALFTRLDVTGITVTPTYTNPSGGNYKLTVAATGKVATSFTKVIGQQNLNIDVSSQVLWGMKKLELALALDNTGSMASSNKMTELKKAAKNLLMTLKTAAKKDEDIRIAIIPFAREVNVGTSNINATWLRWDEWEAENGGSGGGGMFCIFGWCWNGTSWVPQGSGGSGSSNHSSWNGCVMDRDQDYDVLDTAPSTSIKATLFPAKQASNCPVSLLPLTPVSSQHGTLVSKIESMTPVGNTNVTIGLAWGWHALTPNSPLTEGTAPSPEIDKVIILLTDGQNTENRWSTSQSEIDARTKKVCDSVKAAGIKLYTVRVIDGNEALLKACATKPDMYFNVSSATQLDGVFSAISKNLAKLHIAK